MSWDTKVNADKARIASELDRREFWKNVFLKSLNEITTIDQAARNADSALEIFESKFGQGPAA